jgi:hypothetical protein
LFNAPMAPLPTTPSTRRFVPIDSFNVRWTKRPTFPKAHFAHIIMSRILHGNGGGIGMWRGDFRVMGRNLQNFPVFSPITVL